MPDSSKKIKVHLSELDPSIQEEINSMPMADRVKTLEKLGVDDSTWGLVKSTWRQMGEKQAHDFPYPSLNDLPYNPETQEITNPGLIANQSKAAAGMIPMMLGGAGPIAAGIGGLINSKYGPAPSSSEGIGSLLTNMAASRFMPMGSNVLGNIAKGGVQGAVTQGATQGMEALRGEPNSGFDPISLGAQALIPAGVARIGGSITNALERTAPMVRAKLGPLLEGLKPPQINVPEGQLPQVPQPNITQAPGTMDERLAAMIKTLEGRLPQQIPADPEPTLMDLMAKSIAAKTGKMPQVPAETPATVIPPTIKDSLTVQSAPSLDELYKTATASSPLLKSGIKAADRQAIEGLLAKTMPDGSVVARQPSEYISDLVDSADWSSLPKVMEKMDQVYKNGEFNKALQTKITQNVLTGMGTEGPLGDLSILKRIKTFHDQPVGGGQKGRDVLKSVFEGSPEAASNLETMYDTVQHSIDMAGSGKIGKMLVLPGAVGQAAKSLGIDLGTGAGLGGLLSFILPIPATAAAAGGAVAYKIFTLGVDKVADMIAKKNTKWAQVIYDEVRGSSKNTGGTVNNILSGIKARSISSDIVPQGKLLEEMQRRALGEQ